MINISDMCAPDTEEVIVIENEAFSLPWSRQSFLDAIQNENAVSLWLRVVPVDVLFCQWGPCALS